MSSSISYTFYNDTRMWPSSKLEQWYHYWPDWPTGNLRVILTRYSQNSAKFVVVSFRLQINILIPDKAAIQIPNVIAIKELRHLIVTGSPCFPMILCHIISEQPIT